MSKVLRFPTPLPPVPSPVDEFDQAYAELVDAYNANASAQQLLAQTTVRLMRATEQYDAAKLALEEGQQT